MSCVKKKKPETLNPKHSFGSLTAENHCATHTNTHTHTHEASDSIFSSHPTHPPSLPPSLPTPLALRGLGKDRTDSVDSSGLCNLRERERARARERERERKKEKQRERERERERPPACTRAHSWLFQRGSLFVTKLHNRVPTKER